MTRRHPDAATIRGQASCVCNVIRFDSHLLPIYNREYLTSPGISGWLIFRITTQAVATPRHVLRKPIGLTR